jgi:hypothetical protein
MRSPVMVRLLVLGLPAAEGLSGCGGQESPFSAPSSSLAVESSAAAAPYGGPSPTSQIPHAGGLTGHLVYSKVGGRVTSGAASRVPSACQY